MPTNFATVRWWPFDGIADTVADVGGGGGTMTDGGLQDPSTRFLCGRIILQFNEYQGMNRWNWSPYLFLFIVVVGSWQLRWHRHHPTIAIRNRMLTRLPSSFYSVAAFCFLHVRLFSCFGVTTPSDCCCRCCDGINRAVAGTVGHGITI